MTSAPCLGKSVFAAALVSGAALFLSMPLSGADAGAAKKPFTISDLYRTKGVAEPALSPDGKTIVYTVTTSDLAKTKRSVQIWRMDADGKNARRLTYSEKRDEAPRFLPDGRSIAFVSNRNEDSQLFVLPLDGGEPEQKTTFPGGIGSPVISRDGRLVAFSADVYPDCGADAACNKKRDETQEKGKLKAHLADGLLFRHWTDWKGSKRTHILVLELAKGADSIRDLTPGDFDSPVFSVGGAAAFDFSPDTKELVFTSNRDRDAESSTNADLWTVPVEGPADKLAAPKNLTAGNQGWDGMPRYTPDGRFIVFRLQKVPRYESDRFRLALYDRAAGTTRVLTESFDNWINDFSIARDGKRIFFTADVKGRTPLFSFDLASGKLDTITDVGFLDSFEIAPDATWAVLARRRVGNPPELYRVAIPAGPKSAEVRLTTHNADIEKEVDIRPAEEIWVTGADGKQIQVYLVMPHGFDSSKKYPLILNIHGGPQSQFADSFRGDWQVYPGAGYIVAFPNPHGSTGFGQDFTAAISGDWDGKVMEDIHKVTAALKKLAYVDSDRMGAMGWSWGGYAMMWIEGHNDLGFKALASMMGVYDLRAMYSSTEELWFPAWDLKGTPWEQPELYRKTSPSEFVKEFKTPCLVITGEKDFRVPFTQSLEFFTDLQKRSVPSRLIVFEKAGHWPAWYEMALYYDAHLDWFHRYLGGAPAPWDPKEMVGNRVFTDEKEVKDAKKDEKK
jgi:dipeptidyl aminopeptidase/acylaminoacyl peptidase